MTQRVLNQRPAFSDRPFSGDGTSLYATVGTSVRYRNLRVLAQPRRLARKRSRRGIFIKGTGGIHDIAATSVLKTTRIDSAADPTAQFTTALPADLIPPSGTQLVTFDVRTYADDVESETDNFRPVTVEIDSSGDGQTQILGRAQVLDHEVRAGGVVRIRFRWLPSLEGTQPDQFVLSRTAGPSSPSDVTQAFGGGTDPVVVEIDTAALSDASAYTFTISAENTGASVSKDVVVGLSVTADATGPDTPTNGGAEAW